MQILNKLAADSHGHFDRLGAALRYDTNFGDVANGDTFERDRGSALQSARIVEIGAKSKLLTEQTAGRGRHQENDEHKNRHGRQDQCANSQLGPLNLFAARQAFPLDEGAPTSLLHRLENSRKGRGYRAF